MFVISCDKCGSQVNMDYNASLEDYLHKVDYVKDSADQIVDTALSTYLIYRCSRCSSIFKYTWPELEFKLRESVYKDVKRYRKIYVFKNVINPGSINPDNGLIFCGICDGVDNIGNCYKDITKICPFVNKNEA